LLYIDTSVLLPYTLTQALEQDRYRSTEKFFAKIRDGSLSAATSFYALHELYVFALDNAPDFAEGSDFGKAALVSPLTKTDPFSLTKRDPVAAAGFSEGVAA
jgi:hypothetical protein